MIAKESDSIDMVAGEGVGAVAAGLAGSRAPAGEPAACPPNSNTGGRVTEGLSLGLDFLTGTFTLDLLPVIVGLVKDLHGEPVRASGLQQWQGGSWRWEEVGALVAWSESEGWLFLPGRALAKLDAAGYFKLVQDLGDMGVRITRLDGALDDPTQQVLRMDDVHEAAVNGQVLHFRIYKPIVEWDLGKRVKTGDTAYFGRRGKDGSGAYVRFYDKTLESEGEIRGNRMEVEWRGDRARLIWELLYQCDNVGEFVRVLGKTIVGTIDFRDKTGAHKHIDRMERLEWWQRIVDACGSLRVVEKRLKSKLQKTAEWVGKTLQKTMGLIALKIDQGGHDGVEWFREVIEEGKRVVQALDWRAEAEIDFPALVGWRERAASSVAAAVLANRSEPKSREYWAERNAHKLKWGHSGPVAPW